MRKLPGVLAVLLVLSAAGAAPYAARPPEGPPPQFGVARLFDDRPPPRPEEANFKRNHQPPPKVQEQNASNLYLFAALGVIALLGGALILLLIRETTRGRREASKKLSLLATVSHEFRTPLTNLRLYAEMIAGAPQMNEEGRKRCLKIISDEAERLARLVDNVLDYGRLTEHRRKYNLQEIDLPRILRAILSHFDAKAASAGVEISLGGLPEATVYADADAVRQVITNLIDNAIKYARAGRRIALTVGNQGDRVFVDVTDFGPGISAKDSKHIFQRFFRCDNSLAAGIGGAGLGLDIANGLMRGMNGSLTYRPNPAGGCIFRATFSPLSTKKEAL